MLESSTNSESSSDFAKPVRDGGRFANPTSFSSWTGVPTLWSLLKWKLFNKNHSSIPDDSAILDDTLPVHKLTEFKASSNARIFATWLGHATVLVQMEGIRFITDPVWSKRASFSRWVGPKRYRPPPMEIEDLPQLHFGVISHDHYDHLDVDAVSRINSASPLMRWFVPLGLQDWLNDIGVKNTDGLPNKVTEMSWGESRSFTEHSTNVTIWCLPAQHWGQRGLVDRNLRLWCGWAIVTPQRRFFYTGDTGFCRDEFKKIGERLGPFDFAAIPIGAYEPRWFMKPQHINPEEAIEIHDLVKSKFSIGVHWGTYHMGSHEYYLEPKQLIEEIMTKRKSSSKFVTIDMGSMWEEDGKDGEDDMND